MDIEVRSPEHKSVFAVCTPQESSRFAAVLSQISRTLDLLVYPRTTSGGHTASVASVHGSGQFLRISGRTIVGVCVSMGYL